MIKFLSITIGTAEARCMASPACYLAIGDKPGQIKFIEHDPQCGLPSLSIIKLEVVREWLTTLRSGDIEQARGVLSRSAVEMCCLGVLCNIIDPTWSKRRTSTTGGYQREWRPEPQKSGPSYDPEQGALLIPQEDWNTVFQKPNIYEVRDILACLNDTGATFANIADVIGVLTGLEKPKKFAYKAAFKAWVKEEQRENGWAS